MTSLFHITERLSWENAQLAGIYEAPSLATEGFIHLSDEVQVIGTANRFYRGQSGLLLLEIDRDRLTEKLQYDSVLNHGVFPHLYGRLNLEAVIQVFEFEPAKDGTFLAWQ
jgi:uncharacterized protein (DUF952 family)